MQGASRHILQVSVPTTDSFAGLDVNHSCLDQRVPKLLGKELTDYGLGLVIQEGAGRGLVTLRPLSEGETVVVATSDKFSSLSKLMSWLRLPGHGCLADGVVSLNNVQVEEHRPTQTVYCCLLGAGRYIQDFKSIRARPNVVFTARPECGWGSGLLTVQVRTHNGQGIARNTPLCASYGLAFDLERKIALDDSDDRIKKFKGALDHIFSGTSQQQQQETCAKKPPTMPPNPEIPNQQQDPPPTPAPGPQQEESQLKDDPPKSNSTDGGKMPEARGSHLLYLLSMVRMI